MKRFLIIFLSAALILMGIIALLNINVPTQQGINYQWHTDRIPLYLKILDFFDRHYNYKQLVRTIIKDTKTDKERVISIFKWTHANIRKVPAGFPIIDDHVWHIIIRGYGARDQSSDVFTTLCNYAGVDAFFSWASADSRTNRIPLSFVKIEGRWRIFDPYEGVYFEDKHGDFSDLESIKSPDTWHMETIDKEPPSINYSIYFSNLPLIKDIGLTRANTQSPLNRLLFEIKRRK